MPSACSWYFLLSSAPATCACTEGFVSPLPPKCRMKKLMYRVVFPFELKLCNSTDDCPDADAAYDLFGIVVHMGAHPNHGGPARAALQALGKRGLKELIDAQRMSCLRTGSMTASP